MHHLVFGINFQIHFVSLASLVAIHLLIHLSSHLCHHHHSELQPHSYTPSSKPTNPSHLNRLLVLVITAPLFHAQLKIDESFPP